MNDNNIPDHLKDDPMAPYNSEASSTILYPVVDIEVEELPEDDDSNYWTDQDGEEYEL